MMRMRKRSAETINEYGADNYIIVVMDEDHIDMFGEEVSRLMEEAYEPVGGVAVRVGSASGARLLQAMRYKGV